jgi:hypothetical protein
MKNQENWDYELHNCHWNPEAAPDTIPQPTKFNSDYNIKNNQIPEPTPEIPTTLDPIPELKTLNPEPPEPEIIEGPPTPSRIPEQIQDKIIVAHCLPIHIETHTDAFYGEQRTQQTYGKKFTFEAVIVERGDLTMKFWTAAPIPTDSIIYPSRYKNGIKFGEYRWWKVKMSDPRQEGAIYTCLPSDITPDFSQPTS